ncbi:hypothetical protein [Siphonobacter sp. SORGH_AS_1065]|uniref:hypothetical protein n=1 Tax=Siphonobacter sp. SORGH_AS_1065 TaxID=3041795 RepID=UPI00278AB38A|nr:hypothetical protein [Siphonobacter sp. SORGH_AS_1065]MDQ1088532.1 hypothetical protein [Siphonobacter sp. SORGH_AS_1065]
MNHSTSAALVANFCLNNFTDLDQAKLDREYYYAHLPLCVIDSVFSMGVKYESVRNVVTRIKGFFHNTTYREFGSEPKSTADQISITEFRRKLANQTPEELATHVYGNKQRTSSQNGILKAEAVNLFLEVLVKYEVDYFQDVTKLIGNGDFKKDIKRIPGQASGICLSYFFMLAGNDTLIKPDRMVEAFLEGIVGRKCTLTESQNLLAEASNLLCEQGYEMNPRLLDNVIWNYQRKLVITKG